MAGLLIVASIFASEIVPALRGGERARAPGAITLPVEPLRARHGRIERCLRALLGPLHRTGRRLAIELCNVGVTVTGRRLPA